MKVYLRETQTPDGKLREVPAEITFYPVDTKFVCQALTHALHISEASSVPLLIAHETFKLSRMMRELQPAVAEATATAAEHVRAKQNAYYIARAELEAPPYTATFAAPTAALLYEGVMLGTAQVAAAEQRPVEDYDSYFEYVHQI